MYATWVFLAFCILSVITDDYTQKPLQVPWLPAPVWKDFPITKGLNHHRTPVGIILAANQPASCAIESDSLDNVRVRLLNDDSKTERNIVIKSSRPGKLGFLRVNSVSVPFVDGDYLKHPPTDSRNISIFYPSDSKILPIYRFGDDVDKFFELWDSQDAEFAYIESDYFGLLIPKIDKETARNLPEGKNLDDLIAFYDKILIIYSQLIGLSFNDTGTNQNVRNRFFLKADKHGAGMAYYSDWCTAVSSRSIKSFWFDISPTNWGALHEIGHGHELKNLNDDSLSVVEVWNNILAFFYQTIIFGEKMATVSSKQRAMNIVEKLESGTEVKSWGLFHKLSFLTHMFFKAGQESFIRFNQLTRQELAGITYYASGTTLVEKLMHFFAIEFKIDVYPFMKLAKAEIGEEQLLEHYYALASVAYPLNHLISNISELNNVKNKLGLLFDTSLVIPFDLISTKLKNDFTVKIDDRIFNDLSGNKLKLMDGPHTLVEHNIESQTIIFKDIRIGVYKVFIEPNPSTARLIYEDFYAVVHASKPSNLLLSAKVLKIAYLLPDKIKFLGLGDSHFASLSAEPLKNVLKFNSFSGSPHGYYKNKMYISVIIKNQNNNVVFNKSLDGNSPALGLHEINMEGEMKIEIFHAEARDRLKTADPMMDEIIDHTKQTNCLILNERGFQNKNTPMKLLEESFLKKIEFKASKIRRKIFLLDRPYSQPKYDLLLAVEAFERLFNNNSVSTNLRDKYRDCLPSPLVDKNIPSNISSIANEISNAGFDNKVVFSIERIDAPVNSLKLLRNPDYHIATLYMDLQNNKILYDVHTPKPIKNLKDVFISVIIRKEEEEITFSKKIMGENETQ